MLMCRAAWRSLRARITRLRVRIQVVSHIALAPSRLQVRCLRRLGIALFLTPTLFAPPPMRIPRLPLALPLSGLLACVGAVRIHDQRYLAGEFGLSPVQTYFSTNLTPPELKLHRAPPARPRKRRSTELTFIGYRGRSAAQPGPMILDDWGELVWHAPKYGNVLNVERHRCGPDATG